MDNILRKSWENLKKNFGNIFLVILVQSIIVYIIQIIFSVGNKQSQIIGLVGAIISTIITSVISDYIEVEAYLAFKEKRNIRPLGFFKLFSEYDVELLKASLLKTLKIFLWSLLFVIPGIYKTYEYNRVLVSKVDDYELSLSECFEKSKDEMNGRKGQLFGCNLMIALPMIIIFIIIVVIFSSMMVGIIGGEVNDGAIATGLGSIFLLIILTIVMALITSMLGLSLSATFNSELTEYLGNSKKDVGMFSIDYDENQEDDNVENQMDNTENDNKEEM